jgi:NAD(P)-dependent dehydrogenase (short-subunit alcohol dehydrogenase family)
MSVISNPQVVVVTGASAGVGRATAREFAARGARLALIARGRAGLEGARADVEAAGGRALMLPLDVSDAAAVEAAAERVEHELGPVDVWVNNAMVSVFSPVKSMQPDEYKRVIDVTYLGYVYGTLAVLKRMLPRDRGVIVQVGSALAYRGIPLQSAYCAAKHAIQGFMDSLRCELLHDGSRVRVVMVQMPAFNTPQFGWVKTRLPRKPQPVPPIFQPEVGARAIVWAVAHVDREVWVGGSTAAAIAGNAVVPRVADAYLAWSGVEAQQTDGAPPADRADNLWTAVDETRDHGAHGDFDARAYDRSYEFWARMHRGALAIGGLAAGVGLAGLAWSRARRPR